MSSQGDDDEESIPLMMRQIRKNNANKKKQRGDAGGQEDQDPHVQKHDNVTKELTFSNVPKQLDNGTEQTAVSRNGNGRRCPIFDGPWVSPAGLGILPSSYFPPAMQRLLLQHQLDGVRFTLDHLIRGSTGCILGDYMGLGKTLQCISMCSLLLGTSLFRRHCALVASEFRAMRHASCLSHHQLHLVSSSSTHHAEGSGNGNKKRGRDEGVLKDGDGATGRPTAVPSLRNAALLRIVIVAPCGVVPHWLDEFSKFSSVISSSDVLDSPLHCSTTRIGSVHANVFQAYSSSSQSSSLSVEQMRRQLARDSNWMFSVSGQDDSAMAVSVVTRFNAVGGVLCIPYSQVVREDLRHLQADVIILDEGHRIKNGDTNISRFMMRCETPLRMVLTGYPVHNDLSELYQLLLFVSQRRIEDPVTGLGNESFFTRYYAQPLHEVILPRASTPTQTLAQLADRKTIAAEEEEEETKNGDGRGSIAPWLVRRAALLYQRVSHYMLRRGLSTLNRLVGISRGVFQVLLRPTKAQVAAYNHVVTRLNLSPTSLDLLVVGTELLTLPLNRIRSSSEGTVTLSAVRQTIADAASLFQDDRVSPRMRILWQLCRVLKSKGLKIVAFSQFHSVLDEVPVAFGRLDAEEEEAAAATLGSDGDELSREFQRLYCGANPVRIARCDGLVPVETRHRLCMTFNRDNSTLSDEAGIDLMLFSLRSGCEGLNLTGASMIVSLDVSYNPAVEHEAFARAYRLGQQHCVDVVVLTVIGSAEDHRFQLQCGKKNLSDVAIDGLLHQMTSKHDRSTVGVRGGRVLDEAHAITTEEQKVDVETVSGMLSKIPLHSYLTEALPFCLPLVYDVRSLTADESSPLFEDDVIMASWLSPGDKHLGEPVSNQRDIVARLAEVGRQELEYERVHLRRAVRLEASSTTLPSNTTFAHGGTAHHADDDEFSFDNAAEAETTTEAPAIQMVAVRPAVSFQASTSSSVERLKKISCFFDDFSTCEVVADEFEFSDVV